jgi:hypothetical protein
MKPANFTRFSDNQITDAGNTVDFGIPVLEVQGYTFGRLYAGAIQGSATPASSRKIPMKRVTRSLKPSARTPSLRCPHPLGAGQRQPQWPITPRLPCPDSLRHTERNRGKLPLRPLCGGRRWTRDRLPSSELISRVLGTLETAPMNQRGRSTAAPSQYSRERKGCDAFSHVQNSHSDVNGIAPPA